MVGITLAHAQGNGRQSCWSSFHGPRSTSGWERLQAVGCAAARGSSCDLAVSPVPRVTFRFAFRGDAALLKL